jgi:hypothetical protein
VVIVLNPKAFKLPRVDKEKFITLIRYGLDYNRDAGTFSIKTYNNIEKAIEIVSAILGDQVVFQQICTRCGKSFSCSTCSYPEVCTTKNLPFTCVCPQCLRDRKNFEQYLTKF